MPRPIFPKPMKPMSIRSSDPGCQFNLVRVVTIIQKERSTQRPCEFKSDALRIRSWRCRVPTEVWQLRQVRGEEAGQGVRPIVVGRATTALSKYFRKRRERERLRMS